MRAFLDALQTTALTRRIGYVQKLSGLTIEADGPAATVGELCTLERRNGLPPVWAEVVAIRPGRIILLPYGSIDGLAAGGEVLAMPGRADIGVGPALLGRVIDGFGNALDDRAAPVTTRRAPLKSTPLNPMQRPRITRVLETGVRCIDGLLTLGQGQRVGIFSGSGVGKSTLLGMIARHVEADVNVIALIGERGREVRDFIEQQLGPQGLRRSVVVVATSDQPALARLRASHAAVAIAEYFRDAGQQVLLTMDSVTRFAMARREVGLAAGEPPTARGYTPSVFADLPALCERCGTAPSGGSITALFTVLVEGDDLNEPISDTLRATLDGHIALSRVLAQQAHFPAIDVLKSTSRLMRELVPAEMLELTTRAVKRLALLDRNRQMIDIGAYERGSNPELDEALRVEAALNAFLQQSAGGVARQQGLDQLATALREAA